MKEKIQVLTRTPDVLRSLLSGLDDSWLRGNEGPDTWSPYQVVGHLIHGEKTDWIDRARIIMSDKEDKTFVPFDRFAQEADDPDRSLEDMLNEFQTCREENLAILQSMNITEDMLHLPGIHPDLGHVNLGQLLSTWCCHDLAHLNQISRTMQRQMRSQIGPWYQYFSLFSNQA